MIHHIHELFEEEVLKSNDSIAMVYEGNHITYSYLNGMANKLANYLTENYGINSGNVVGVCIRRTEFMLVALLALLKAGAAYVMLDPNHPQPRIQYTLLDSRVRVLLSTKDLFDKCQDLDPDIVYIDQLNYENYPDGNLSITLPKDSVAYIMYTSGTTGFPKGVMVSHRNIVNYVSYVGNGAIGEDRKHIGYLNSPYTDLGYTSLFTSLLKGRTLYILKEGQELELDSLVRYIYLEQIDLIKTTPSYYAVLEGELTNIEGSEGEKLREYIKGLEFILGGEALSSKYVNSNRRITNHYGPTETTIGVTTNKLDTSKFGVEEYVVPIGKPIWNTKIYILDDEMNLVPIGSKGEIYITGAGVAHGYVNRAELTSEKFVANPFRTREELELRINGRLYRTGDIGRYLSDGNIEFIGRKDHQVKIRGYRIELGEIENILRKHGDIRDCVVSAEDSTLIAYIVHGEFKVTEVQLKNYLEKNLPSYMIPSYYVELEKLPLTTSGKVDRKGLPGLEEILGQVVREGGYKEPRDEIEKDLCDIWQEVLGLERVGIEDDFFKLGGHSLLAIKLISRVRRKYDIEIKLMSLFDKPRIKEFKEDVAGEVGNKNRSKIQRIPRLESRPVRAELSFAQQRLWFLDKLLPDAVIYNMPVALELKGKLDRDALRRAFERIVERHEILRTIFKETESGEAYQEILKTVEVYEEIDLTEAEDKEGLISEYKLREAGWKFKLDEASLCRVKLLILDEEHHVLLITMHHIISDGWSLNILFEEMSKIYSNNISGHEDTLPEPIIQYVDYSLWQRNWLSGDNLERQLSYWKEKLRDIPSEIGLPMDRPRPKELSYKGGHYYFELSEELSDKVHEVCEKEGVSLYMFLLSVLNVLLYKLSGNSDIVVGSPIAGRHYEEVEELIGFFINTLVIRTNVKGRKSFKELLLEVRSNSLESYQYQDIPFEKLVDSLDAERATNKNPLFQVMIDIKNINQSIDKLLKDIDISVITNNYDIMKFDLEFIIYRTKDKVIGIRINYVQDLYDNPMVRKLSGYYKNIIENVVKNIEERIGNINILEPEDLLYQTNLLNKKSGEDTQTKHLMVHELFEQKVLEFPDSIAIIEENNCLTYNELNNMANSLAYYLTSKGISIDVLIGLSSVRGINAIIGILAILKSGGTYVPIDHNYPDERISYILVNSGAKLLIVNRALKHRFENLFKGEIVCVEDLTYIEEKESKNLNKFIPIYSLAYLIYTSGTTGGPKGVMMTHDALSSRLRSLEVLFQLSKNDKVSQQASLSFDVSLQEILCTLTSGATLHIMKEDISKDSDKLIKTIQSNQITVIEFIPSFLNNLLSTYDFSKNICLSKVIVGGEPLSQSLIEIFKKKLDAQLINMCGPTEVCMDATYWICDYHIPRLGKPLNETYAYILDNDLNIVPFGQAGELYFSTKAMARGYNAMPELTAEKFIANSLGDRGDRLYRSGDIVKWLPDGNLDYLGRKDFQVKIRGFRVEIEEVEKVLGSFDGINQKIIIVKTHPNTKNKYLVCYYSGPFEIDNKKIIEYLKMYLPEYMVPNAFVFLPEIPVNINGKIDRKALPEHQHFVDNYFLPPRNDIEKLLCEVWQEVLGINKVGINDNFFRLGGDSIITIQALSKARTKGIIFNLKDIFDYPQISSLSKVCKVVDKSDNSLNNTNEKVIGIIPLIPIQHYFFKLAKNFNHYNQSVILSCDVELNIKSLMLVIEKIIDHHDILRARYKAISGNNGKIKIVQKIYKKASYISDYHDFSESKKLEIDINNACNEIHKKINIFASNLVGVGIYYLGKDLGYRIFIAVHHLVVDEVSWRIIKEDLENGYKQLENKGEITLNDKTTSYKDWSNYLSMFSKKITENEIKFWQDLEDKLSKHKLEPQNYGKSNHVNVAIGKKSTFNLLRNVNRAYKTDINDILLSSLSLALQDWKKELDEEKRGKKFPPMIVDVEGHGREDIIGAFGTDLSRTVGWFTTIYPLDIETQSTRNFGLGELIKEIKEIVRIVPNKGIGYGVLKLYDKLNCYDNDYHGSGILFNYLSNRVVSKSVDKDSKLIFNFSSDPKGLNSSEDNNLSHGIEINCGIYNEMFSIRFTYDDSLYSNYEIELLAKKYLRALEEIITYCLDKKNFGYTVSDFKSLSSLTQEAINQKLDKIPDIQDAYPLSTLQSGFLFTEAMLADSNDSSGYLVQSTYRINGVTDIESLKLSWDILIQNNEILRTGFLWESLKEPVQFVIENCKNDFRFLDLKFLDKEEVKSSISDLAHKEKLQKFDLSRPPLNRVLMALVDDDESYMIWTTHHIISDGWSSSLLLQELKNIYSSLIQGKMFISNILITYKEYINWISCQDKAKAIGDWGKYLEHLDQNNSLQFGYSTPQNSYKASDSDFFFEIDPHLSKNFKESALNNNLTPNTLFQAVFGIILYKYAQLKDFTFGITVSGRSIDLDGVQSLIGLTINTLPLRVKIDNNQLFNEFLQDLRDGTFFINKTCYTSLAEIQKLVIKGKEHLFNTIFVYENYPQSSLEQTDNSIKFTKFGGFSKTEYQFTLIIHPSNNFIIRIIYNSDCFTYRFLEEFKENFISLMKIITEKFVHDKPNLILGDIISSYGTCLDQRKMKNTEFNDNTTLPIYAKTVYELFQEIVMLYPDRICIIYQDKQVTYKEINMMANKLANYMRINHTVQPNQLVALDLPRNDMLIVSLLAILKLGAAYVAIDPLYPEERISYILVDSDTELVLTTRDILDKRQYLPSQTILCIDELDYNGYSTNNIDIPSDIISLAYIIYTSGSTGKPKGVMVRHQGIINYVNYIVNNIISAENIAYFNGIGTDLGYTALYGSLLSGRRLYVFPQNIELETVEILNLIRREQIELIKTTPSYYAVLEDAAEKYIGFKANQIRDAIKKVHFILGGEALPSKYIRTDRYITNHYGPTETTIGVTTNHVGNSKSDDELYIVPIGRAIAGTKLYILDQEMNLGQIEGHGEIYITGPGVAQGYINKPDLTAEKFVANPFRTKQEVELGIHSRLYRTGDIGRYNKSGDVGFIGRKDDQVKIRGYRIELGEIESLLKSHGDVKDAVVVVDGSNIIAYIVIGDFKPSEIVLSRYLGKHLPSYMIPIHYIEIEKFPLTNSGKVDRKSLPKLSESFKNYGGQSEYIEPRNELEKWLVSIWQELLGIEKIGINDNFFKLGGHSIKLMQLASVIRAKSYNIPITHIFQNMTIRELSLYILKLKPINSRGTFEDLFYAQNIYQLIDKCSLNKGSPKLDVILPISMDSSKMNLDKLFIVHPGGGLAFPYLFIEKYINSCVFGINNPNFYQPDLFKNVKEIAEYYFEEIIKVQPYGTYNLAGFSFGGYVAYEIAQIISRKINQESNVILMDSAVDFSKLMGSVQEAKYCDDELINNQLNKNVKYFSTLSEQYKFERNSNRVLFLKNKKNNGSLKELCANYREVIIKGTHATFLSEDTISLTNEINAFLSF